MQTILITGVSSGIGQALAEEYIKRGDAVFGIGRNPAKSIMSEPNFYFLPLDFTEPDLILDDMKKFVSGRFFDLVVLNAGTYTTVQKLSETTIGQIQEALNVNLLSAKHTIDAVLTHAKAEQIVAISTDFEVFGHHGFGAHIVSKAALNSLIQLYAEEFPNVQFNTMATELIQTPTLSKFLKIPDPERHPYVQKIRDRFMVPLDQAIPQLIDSFAEAKHTSNGSFVEMKKLKKQRISL